jgi:hypothetical protein
MSKKGRNYSARFFEFDNPEVCQECIDKCDGMRSHKGLNLRVEPYLGTNASSPEGAKSGNESKPRAGANIFNYPTDRRFSGPNHDINNLIESKYSVAHDECDWDGINALNPQ